ncbi:hypothetical protein AX17_003858 [Amanita inopinata Kibby_2008]|nr:hypothetical protein AX17_003858 [Amanita inopinata Kibby_2008]
MRRSNERLSNLDEALVRNRLQLFLSFSDGIDDLVANSQSTYHDTLSLQKLCLELQETYEAALAPHKQLPPEILRQIFLFCVSDKPAKFPQRSEEIRVSLSQVCSGWRRVALDTPQLWSEVQVHTLERRQLLKLSIWLQRSKSYPLKLKIRGSYNWEELFDLVINRFAGQISHLYLWCMGQSGQMFRQLGLCATHLVRLQVLSLLAERYSDTGLSLTGLPYLRHLVLRYNIVSAIRVPLDIPMRNLVHIHVHSRCSADVVLQVLQESVVLDEFNTGLLRIDGDLARRLRSKPNFPIPCLRKLKIDCASYENFSDFLRPIKASSLKVLLLTGDILPWDTSFVTFLSQNPLNNLEVLYTGIPVLHYDRRWRPSEQRRINCSVILDRLPSLQAVHFPPEFSVTDEVLAQIGSRQLLPHLKQFHIHTENLNAVLQMIEQRQSTASPIETIFITCKKTITRRHRLRIEDLQEGGIRVGVTSSFRLPHAWIDSLFPMIEKDDALDDDGFFTR